MQEDDFEPIDPGEFQATRRVLDADFPAIEPAPVEQEEKLEQSVAPLDPDEARDIRVFSGKPSSVLTIAEWLRNVGEEQAIIAGNEICTDDGVPVSRMELAARMAMDALLAGEIRFPGTNRTMPLDARNWLTLFNDVIRHIGSVAARDVPHDVGGPNVEIMARAVVDLLATARVRQSRPPEDSPDVVDVSPTTPRP